MPVFSSDYFFATKSLNLVRAFTEGDGAHFKVLAATVSTGKAMFAHTVDVKGAGGDRYAVQRLVGDVCWLLYIRV